MFREGHHVQKKNKQCCEQMQLFFFVIVSCFCHGKSMQNCAKTVQNSYLCKHRQKINIGKKNTFGTQFWSKKTKFTRFLESFWVPGGLPGRPGSLPEFAFFFLQLRLKTSPEGSLGGPRKAPGRPRASPRHPPGHYFGSIWDRLCTSKNIKKVSILLQKNDLKNQKDM